MEIVGYSERWSIEPGAQLDIRVSSRAGRFHASLVRLQHGEADPAGPGVREFPVNWDGEGDYTAGWYPIPSGSFMTVSAPDIEAHLSATVGTLALWIRPHLLADGPQVIAATSSWRIFMDQAGRVHFASQAARACSSRPLRCHAWAQLVVRWAGNTADVSVVPKVDWPDAPVMPAVAEGVIPERGMPGIFSLAGLVVAEDETEHHFTGKLADLRLYDRWLPGSAIGALFRGEALPRPDLHWPMTDDPRSRQVREARKGLHGQLHRQPTRGVTGPGWDGVAQSWRGNPQHYGAVLFNAEDKVDAGWPVAFSLRVPDDCPSDVYAVKLVAEDSVDYVPFFVRATGRRNRILFLAPTFSYLAYGNEHTASYYIRTMPQMAAYNAQSSDPYPAIPEQRYILESGLNSLYDIRSDGFGTCYASTKLPVLNFRPHTRFRMLDSLRGGAHQFMADLFIIDWLHEKGFAFDVATDHDLHREGKSLLADYDVVITGTHSEYVSMAEQNAISAYVSGGGRLMYMGGNGFYWVTSLDEEDTSLMEVRRAHGTGAWAVPPGERHHATTGEQGGLWKDRGRPPQALLGVGFTSDSISNNAPYTVKDVPSGSLAETILRDAGLAAGDTLGGEQSLVMGKGAAGFEVDRIDANLGSPPGTICLASALLPGNYVLAVDEIGTHAHTSLTSATNPALRADCALVPYPHDGYVFSTGSVNWAGCLSADGYRSTVSRLTGAVLRRFLTRPRP